MKNIFKYGGGAGIGSYVIIAKNNDTTNSLNYQFDIEYLPVRMAYEAGDNLYLSIIDADTQATLLPLEGFIADVPALKDNLYLIGRDYDDLHSYCIRLRPSDNDVKAEAYEGIIMGDWEYQFELDVPAFQYLVDGEGKITAGQDVFDGYYDGGVFYKDAAHTEVIEARSNSIYIDVPNNSTYRYDGAAYVQIGGGVGTVTSVNGETGDVVLTGSKINVSGTDTTKIDVKFDNVNTALSNKLEKIKIDSTELPIDTHVAKIATDASLSYNQLSSESEATLKVNVYAGLEVQGTNGLKVKEGAGIEVDSGSGVTIKLADGSLSKGPDGLKVNPTLEPQELNVANSLTVGGNITIDQYDISTNQGDWHWLDNGSESLQQTLETKQDVIGPTTKLDANYIDDSSSTNKFVTEAEKTKLAGISEGANKVESSTNGKIKIDGTDTTVYELPKATSGTLGGIKSQTTGTVTGRDYLIEVDADGKAKVNVPWTDTVYSAGNGVEIDADNKIKAKVNTTDNYLKVDTNGINVDDTKIQKKLTAGANIQIAADNTISATDTTYENKASASGGIDVSLVTTGDKYNWNNKIAGVIVGDELSPDANRKVTITLQSTFPEAAATAEEKEVPSVKGVRDFVNSSISASAANKVSSTATGDNFATYAALLAGPYFHSGSSYTPVKNDYAIVAADETHGGNQARYKYNGTAWEFDYVIGSTFTAAQQAALDSGITQDIKNAIVTQVTYGSTTHKLSYSTQGGSSTDVYTFNTQDVLQGATLEKDTSGIAVEGTVALTFTDNTVSEITNVGTLPEIQTGFVTAGSDAVLSAGAQAAFTQGAKAALTDQTKSKFATKLPKFTYNSDDEELEISWFAAGDTGAEAGNYSDAVTDRGTFTANGDDTFTANELQTLTGGVATVVDTTKFSQGTLPTKADKTVTATAAFTGEKYKVTEDKVAVLKD